jgi:hypothetical protein
MFKKHCRNGGLKMTRVANLLKQEAIAETEKRKDIELATKMFVKNMSIQEIMEFTTELTETELKNIQELLKNKI